MHTFNSPYGLIALTNERKRHILSFHPDVAGCMRYFPETLSAPERIVASVHDPSVVICYRFLKTQKASCYRRENRRSPIHSDRIPCKETEAGYSVSMVKYFYDKEADVFYFSQGTPSPKDETVEAGDDVLLRIVPRTKKVRGFTLMNASRRSTQRKIASDLPFSIVSAIR